jgi:hypothetical protein
MADFTPIPHVFQLWDTDSSSHPSGSLNESLHLYAGYHQVERSEQPGHHPAVAPVHGSRSVGMPPQHSFDQRFASRPKEINHPKSTFYGWNDRKIEQVNPYDACGTSSGSYPKHGYVYTGESTGQRQHTTHDSSAYQQSVRLQTLFMQWSFGLSFFHSVLFSQLHPRIWTKSCVACIHESINDLSLIGDTWV